MPRGDSTTIVVLLKDKTIEQKSIAVSGIEEQGWAMIEAMPRGDSMTIVVLSKDKTIANKSVAVSVIGK